MASVESREHKHCECRHGCTTSAIVTEWSCGCVEVSIIDDSMAGSDCTDFSSMRQSCGRPGTPRED